MSVTRLGTGSLLLAIALSACSSDSDKSDALPDLDPTQAGPSDVAPSLAPATTGRMEVAPATYRPGDLVKVTWPGKEERGVAYSLDRWAESDWQPAYYLSAATNGYRKNGQPKWWSVDEKSGAVARSIGTFGPGPDTVVVPETATAGTYRLCTANSVRLSCALVEVI